MAIFITAFLLGIGGSLHCVGMCGPLVMGIPFQNGNVRKSVSLVLYHIGKSTAYGLLGIVLGLFGKGISLMNWQQALSIIAGLLIILFAFLPHLLQSNKINFLFGKKFGTLLQQVRTKPKAWHFSALGFLNGFLPCGLVYTALAGASVTADPFKGFLFMFIFGIGTVPALGILGIFKSQMGQTARAYLRRTSLIISLVLGSLLIARGLNLGIPYISPKMTANKEVKGCCSSKEKTVEKKDTIECH